MLIAASAQIRLKISDLIMPVPAFDEQKLPRTHWMIFVMLEGETGGATSVVSNELPCRQRRLLLGSRLLGVAGQLQVEGEGEHAVVHLVAKRLFDHTELLGALVAGSRDFH